MADYAVIAYTIKQLVETIGSEDSILVTMNGKSFDQPIIDRCLGNPVFEGMKHFDVYQAACRYYPDMKSRKLGDLYRHFFKTELANAHDAAVDVSATMDVAEVMKKQSHLKWDELIADLDVPKPYSIMPFGKYAGLTADELPRSWATYMNKIEELSPDLRATVDYVLGL